MAHNGQGEVDWGEPIHVYTREQALADGVLIAMPKELALEAGYGVPVLLTRAAWSDLVQWPEGEGLQDETGRAWDVLWMARSAAQRAVVTGEAQGFRMLRVAVGGPVEDGEPLPEEVTVRLVAERNTESPAFTIMLETED